MKTTTFILYILVGLNLSILSQDYLNDNNKHDQYVARIKFIKDEQMKKGYLQSLNDSSLILTEISDPKTEPSLTIEIKNIEEIQLRLNDNLGIGECTLYGFLIGAGSGILIGLLSGNDPPSNGHLDLFNYTASEKAVLYGLTIGGVGTLIGLLIGASSNGSSKIKIPIYGKQRIYELNKKKLERYTY